jgi:acetyl esterase/lipase
MSLTVHTALATLLMSGFALAADPAPPATTLNLWPAAANGSTGTVQPDKGDNIRRITDVVTPTISVFPAPKAADGKPVPAVLVCPGGGYGLLAIDLEGTEIVQWLNSIGVTAVLLKYRVPGNRDGAFQDAQRAMSLIRQNAKQWNIAPDRVGVIGFSAGAHLAARLSTGFQKRSYPPADAADKLSSRPDFAILVYPAYLVKPDNASLADEITVTPKTPQAFLVQTQDDQCRVECSLLY